MNTKFNRRQFLKLALLTACPMAASAQPAETERQLGFHNLHTGEQVSIPYWIQGEYLPESLAAINHVLRDHRTNQVAAIDTHLLDLLHRLNITLGTNQPFEVISGYRSPASNHLLFENTSGVARHSLHMEGKAIDVRIPGIPLADLQHGGLLLHGGGVGYYPASNFVHLDTGRPRAWSA